MEAEFDTELRSGDVRTHSVLVVDDEEEVARTLERLLTRNGYAVRVATSGPEALAMSEQEPPDLVLCDYMMPDMNGIEVFQALATLCPDAVRVLITGHADLDVAVSAINDASVYKFVRKPWHQRDLLLVVRRALEHRHLIQEGKVLVDMLEMALRQKQVQVRGLEHQVERYRKMLNME